MFLSETDPATATGATADYFAGQRAAWGFLPNYAHCFGLRPEVGIAWGGLNAAIRDGMDRRRFEIATIAAARELRSTYCTSAHSKFLRDVCGDDEAVRAIAEDPTGGGLGEVDRAVFRFATKVARDASSIDAADIEELKDVGLGEVDIADVVYAVAARSFFTKVLDGLGAQLDSETAATFEPALGDAMVVGRLPADPVRGDTVARSGHDGDPLATAGPATR
ncbi:carboxymuconolactone decarboxylase family protein [Knoellia sp. Soil729]|uniref:carboxymuconolactone decarboxylase family protein n=1 Tax=Knoellia sp. Soil729 TaxID=1736394 RepID=UPI0012E8AADD|nr:carboxymuconolactone decarboxylase family protein [Knoellia sp. Soil729]